MPNEIHDSTGRYRGYMRIDARTGAMESRGGRGRNVWTGNADGHGGMGSIGQNRTNRSRGNRESVMQSTLRTMNATQARNFRNTNL